MRGIVLHKYKAVYWYIQKNACSTLKSVVAELLGMKVPEHKPGQYDYAVHNLPFEIIKEQKFPDYFHFAFVRNPIDRAISCWKNKIRETPVTDEYFKNGVERYDLLRYNMFHAGMSFDDFAITISQKISTRDADPHFKPQHLLIPKANLYIARVENIDEEIRKILKIIGAKHRYSGLPRLNSTNKHKAKIYAPPCLIEYYRQDFLNYGYKINP